MKRQVQFYKNKSGDSPIEKYLDSLPGKVAQKIAWVLSAVEELEIVPSKYFKKLESKIYECRIDFGGNAYRLLGFYHSGNIIILTNGFNKKSNKIPREELELCKKRMKDFLDRGR